jgi:hypothetical protein
MLDCLGHIAIDFLDYGEDVLSHFGGFTTLTCSCRHMTVSSIRGCKEKMLSDEQLADIEERQKERREYRSELPPGRWRYESFAFLENCSDFDMGLFVGLADLVCILVRRRAWIDGLLKACGEDILDAGTVVRGDEKDLQPALVGRYIVTLMDGSVENDINLLLDEVRRLRNSPGPK